MTMNKYKITFVIIVILIIAGSLRLYQITTIPPGLYPDEAIGANQGLQAVRTGDFKLFYPENNGREGLFINIQGLSEELFGADKPWAARLPSAIFGTLTVLGLYFLSKELFGGDPKSEIRNPKQITNQNAQNSKRFEILGFINWNLFRVSDFGFRISRSEAIGLLSAFLLATSFWHINFSRIGFSAVMAPFFLVWAVYFLIKAFKAKDPAFYILHSTFSGILYGLGFHSYIPYRVTPVLIFFILFWYWRKSKRENLSAFGEASADAKALADKPADRQKRFLITASYFLISAFIVALPIGIYFLTHPSDFSQRTSQISVFNSKTPLQDIGLNIVKTLGMFNFRGDGNWRHNYPDRPELFWPVGILFLAGIFLSIRNMIRNSRFKNGTGGEFTFPLFILFLWFALGAAPAVISNEGLPHALRSILMIPPAILFAGIGGVTTYDFLKKYILSFWLPLAGIIFLSLLVFEAYDTYFIVWAKNPNTYAAFSNDYVELGRKLNELPASMPTYVIVKVGGVLVNGIPVPAQTVMFITDTYSIENQKAKNIYYILPDQENNLPRNSFKFYLD